MSADDIYGDLDDIALESNIDILKEQLAESQKCNQSLTTTVEELKDQVEALLADRKKLETNITIVYNTALREIERRVKEISNLTQQLRQQSHR